MPTITIAGKTFECSDIEITAGKPGADCSLLKDERQITMEFEARYDPKMLRELWFPLVWDGVFGWRSLNGS